MWFYFLKKGLELSPSEIFLIAGLGTVPVIVYMFGLLPSKAFFRSGEFVSVRTV